MKAQLILAALGATASLAATASAQGPYLGGGLGYVFDDDVSFTTATVRGGFEFTPNFAVEAEGQFGLTEESFEEAGIDVDVSLNYALGVFGKASFPMSEQMSLFARAGYVTAELEAEAAGISVDESDEGFGFGAGAEFMLSENGALRGDYTRYEFDGDGFNGISVTYVLKF